MLVIRIQRTIMKQKGLKKTKCERVATEHLSTESPEDETENKKKQKTFKRPQNVETK